MSDLDLDINIENKEEQTENNQINKDTHLMIYQITHQKIDSSIKQ
jgi:hypothetical protein